MLTISMGISKHVCICQSYFHCPFVFNREGICVYVDETIESAPGLFLNWSVYIVASRIRKLKKPKTRIIAPEAHKMYRIFHR